MISFVFFFLPVLVFLHIGTKDCKNSGRVVPFSEGSLSLSLCLSLSLSLSPSLSLPRPTRRILENASCSVLARVLVLLGKKQTIIPLRNDRIPRANPIVPFPVRNKVPEKSSAAYFSQRALEKTGYVSGGAILSKDPRVLINFHIF